MVAINNIINNTVGASNSGVTNTLTIDNASNTASSQAQLNITVGGGTAGDAYTTYTVSGTTNWSEGVDNSDSDAYVLSASTSLGTTNVIHCTTAGEINYPLQPAFLGFLGSQDSNVTGDGTAYTLGGTTALTEVFDQNSDFNTNGTFTAPVTGDYQLTCSFYVLGLLSTHTKGEINIVTSNRNYYRIWNAFNSADNSTNTANSCSFLCDMDAADTATTRITVSNGTKVVDIGSSGAASSFAGFLAC